MNDVSVRMPRHGDTPWRARLFTLVLWTLLQVTGTTPTAAASESLEQQIVAEINALRADPGAWAELLAARRQWYDSGVLRRPTGPPVRTREGIAALEEAIVALRALPAIPRLEWLPVLERVAREHVSSAGPAGRIGHTAPDGLTLAERLLRHGVEREEVAEAISYGPDRAREVVASLVVDDGVQGRPHREMLLDPRYVDIGVACAPHATRGTMCVLLLAVARTS